MNPRRIPFITTMSSSESENDVEPKTRLFRKQKHKKYSIGGVPTSTGPAIPSAVSEVLIFIISKTEPDTHYSACAWYFSQKLKAPVVARRNMLNFHMRRKDNIYNHLLPFSNILNLDQNHRSFWFLKYNFPRNVFNSARRRLKSIQFFRGSLRIQNQYKPLITNVCCGKEVMQNHWVPTSINSTRKFLFNWGVNQQYHKTIETLLILLVGVVSEFVIEFLHIGNGFLLPLT